MVLAKSKKKSWHKIEPVNAIVHCAIPTCSALS